MRNDIDGRAHVLENHPRELGSDLCQAACLPGDRSATQGFIVVGAGRWAQCPPNSLPSEEKKCKKYPGPRSGTTQTELIDLVSFLSLDTQNVTQGGKRVANCKRAWWASRVRAGRARTGGRPRAEVGLSVPGLCASPPAFLSSLSP